MAHKKGAGSTKNGKDSRASYLGVKVSGNKIVRSGEIVLRQRGLTFRPGYNVSMGKDYTIFSVEKGRVRFDSSSGGRFVHVLTS